MWPPFPIPPPKPPKEPELAPTKLGRCRHCGALTERACPDWGCGARVCPRPECRKDHEKETSK